MHNILFIYISLKDSQIRQKDLESQLAKLKNDIKDIKIDYCMFNAINGKKLPKEYVQILDLRRQLSNICSHSLGPSEFGCLLSHLMIWQKLVNGDYKHYSRIVILEDDVILNYNHIEKKLKHILDSKPDFAFLGGHNATARRRIRGYSHPNQLCFNLAGPKDLYTGAFAYTLTPSTAEHFIYKQTKSLTYLDDWTYLLKNKLTVPFYYCFDHNYELESSIVPDRDLYMKKPNRFKKNYTKIKNDIISRIISLFLFKNITRLSTFTMSEKNKLQTFDKL